MASWAEHRFLMGDQPLGNRKVASKNAGSGRDAAGATQKRFGTPGILARAGSVQPQDSGRLTSSGSTRVSSAAQATVTGVPPSGAVRPALVSSCTTMVAPSASRT